MEGFSSPNDMTWEPAKQLKEDVPDMVQDYEDSLTN